jgi:2-dehydro-3-deoxygluconokinase
MSSGLDVLTYGEAMALFVADEPGPLAQVGRFTKRIAGADLNFAIGLARLGFKVGWMSRVGHDSFGHYVLDTLAKEGIDARHVAVDDRYPTGFQLKSTESTRASNISARARPRAICRSTTTRPTMRSPRAICI